jgi:hypothetical protein
MTIAESVAAVLVALMMEANTTTSGLNHTGNWTAWLPVQLGSSGGTTTLPTDCELTWEISTGGGTGATVPTGRLFVACVRSAVFTP